VLLSVLARTFWTTDLRGKRCFQLHLLLTYVMIPQTFETDPQSLSREQSIIDLELDILNIVYCSARWMIFPQVFPIKEITFTIAGSLYAETRNTGPTVSNPIM
jgi:hypothetical protein